VELIDCNPASCELAGIGVSENLDAQSFVPVLAGEADTHRSEVITMERNYRAVRSHDFKLIENYNDRLELYDMREDPEELKNVVDDNWDTVKELKKRMVERFTEGECLR
jgi:arylsulfatase A-like enzyme